MRYAEEDSNLHPVIPDQALKAIVGVCVVSMWLWSVVCGRGIGRVGRSGRRECCHGRCHGLGADAGRGLPDACFAPPDRLASEEKERAASRIRLLLARGAALVRSNDECRDHAKAKVHTMPPLARGERHERLPYDVWQIHLDPSTGRDRES